MRVVHVYKDYYPVMGGIENYVKLLATRLRHYEDIDARVLVTSPTGQWEQAVLDGVPVYRAGRLATVASTPLSIQLIGALRAQRPDIVHLHFPYPMGEIAYLLGSPQTPSVITYHSDIVRQKRLLTVYGPILKHLLAHADVILPTSPPYLESSPWLRPNRERCRIISSGIDMDEWHEQVEASRPQAATLRRRLVAKNPGAQNRRSQGETTSDGGVTHEVGHTSIDLAPEEDRTVPIILFVGRFRYYKGLHILLQAWPQVQAAHLVLVGSGPEEAALRAQADQLGLTERVTFAGDVPDSEKPAYYAAADLFVLPSCARSEALGMCLMESLGAGVPSISTELGTGTSWLNKDGLTGRVVPSDDPAALAGAVNELLADPETRARMSAAGRVRAAELCDIKGIASQMAALYHELVDTRNKRT